MLKNNQIGRSMIEMLGVIAVIGVISAGVLKIIGTMHNKYTVSRGVQQLQDIRKAVQDRFAADGSYSKVTNTLLQNENILPHDVKWKSGVPKHIFGKDIEITPYTYKVSGDGLQIVYKDLNQPACNALATIGWMNISSSSTMVLLKINGTNYQWKEFKVLTSETKDLPVTTIIAAEKCIDGNNTLTWVFY